MQRLNLPAYQPKLKSKENNLFIFDFVRKKYIKLTPEEWVRQHVLYFLTAEKGYPISLIAVEKQLIINDLKRRFDIVVFNSQGQPYLIVECKAPQVTISQDAFDQVAIYNTEIQASYMMVTNGLQHYYCKIDTEKEQYYFLRELPSYSKE